MTNQKHESLFSRLFPEYPSARNNLAAVLVMLDREDEAIEHLEHIVKQYPAHQNAALNLAKLYKWVYVPSTAK